MEKPSIDSHNLADFPMKPRTLPLGNGINRTDDAETTAAQSMRYISLKDLLPASPSSAVSPTRGSWREIPIRDPLVQHAAWSWAYLQPLAEVRDEDRRWWRRLEAKCRGVLGCLNEVVFAVFRRWFAAGGSDGDWRSVTKS